MKLTLRYDLRRAPFSESTRQELYENFLEQCSWADAAGFDRVSLAEHHGAEDGYCPSSVVLGSAVAARTSKMLVGLKAVLLPLHDPIKLAEDLAILDLVSSGRLRVVFGAGYRPIEFDMFGRSMEERGDLMTEHVGVLRRAWTGQPFEHKGRRIQVTPRPFQRPGPQIVLGGSSHAAARRAARIADGYDPVPPAATTFHTYVDECRRLGKIPCAPRPPHLDCVFLMVADDPEQVWQAVRRYAAHEAGSYARWNAEAGLPTDYQTATDPDDLRRSGRYCVLSPMECVERARRLGPEGELVFHPLMAGLPPDIAWRSLELVRDAVAPHLPALGR